MPTKPPHPKHSKRTQFQHTKCPVASYFSETNPIPHCGATQRCFDFCDLFGYYQRIVS